MPRFLSLILFVPLLWNAGATPGTADPILVTSGSIVATGSEFRITVPGPGWLVVDLFNAPGVYHTPLAPGTVTVVGGSPALSGQFRQGSFALDGVEYPVPVGFQWQFWIQETRVVNTQVVSGVPFAMEGTFSHPGFGTVELRGGGFLSMDLERTVFALVENPPDVTVVPEPASLVLVGSGLAAVVAARRRRRR